MKRLRRIRMEIDSKPDVIDRIERQIMQKRMEISVLESDEDTEKSGKRLEDLKAEVAELEEEHSSLNERWKREQRRLRVWAHCASNWRKPKPDWSRPGAAATWKLWARSAIRKFPT